MALTASDCRVGWLGTARSRVLLVVLERFIARAGGSQHSYPQEVSSMERTMKAAVVHRFGGPLKIEEVEVPRPGAHARAGQDRSLRRMPHRSACCRRRLHGNCQLVLGWCLDRKIQPQNPGGTVARAARLE